MSFTGRTADLSENKTVTQDHSLEVDGILLREKKVVTTYCYEASEKPWRTEKCHARSIGDRVYTVTEIKNGQDDEPVRRVTTSMTEDQVASFQEEWDLKWKPMVNEDVVAQAQENPFQREAPSAPSDQVEGEEQPMEKEKENVQTEEMEMEVDQSKWRVAVTMSRWREEIKLKYFNTNNIMITM